MKAIGKLLLVLFVISGLNIYAQKAEEAKQDKKPFQFLELTADQESQVEKITLEARENSKVKKLDLKEKEIQLEKLMIADKPDEKAIMAKVDEIMAVKTALQKEAVMTKLAIKEILTPEQVAKYNAKMEQKKNRKQGQKGKKGKKGAKKQKPNK